MFVWFHHHLKFLGKEHKPTKGPLRCGCNNVVSSSQNICQLEKYFCPYWPNNCRSYVSNDVLEITKDILINNNNNQQCLPSDYQAGLKESAVDDIDVSDDIVTDESDLNSSSLVLILPSSSSSSQIQKSEAKHKTKVYSVASLKSPRLVLTLLRGRNGCTGQPETRKNSVLVNPSELKSSTKLMRKISHFDQRLYKEEPLLHCRRLQCL